MRFFTLILMLTSCTFSNGSQISRKSNAFPKSDQLLLSSLTEAQREQLRSHFLTLLGVSTVQPAFNFNISLQANDLRASLPLTRKPALSAFDFNPRTIAQKSHVRSRREALPAHAHYLAGLRAIHFENLQLPTGRSLGAVSAVRIHASRGASKVRRFLDGSVGLILSFVAPSSSEPIAHSELRLSNYQSPNSIINRPVIIELYDVTQPTPRLLDRQQVLVDAAGVHDKSINATAFDTSRAVERAQRTGAKSVTVMLKFVPANWTASNFGGLRVRRDTSAAVEATRNENTVQELGAHLFTYVKGTERPAASQSQEKASGISRRRTRRSADPIDIDGTFGQFLTASTSHRFHRGKRQQLRSRAPIGGRSVNAAVNVNGGQGAGGRQCGRRYMYVNFTALGLEQYIAAPEGYVAWFCKGSCDHPLDSHLNPTTHATLQALVHNMHPGLVPAPCCSPTSLSGLTMLVRDEDGTFTVKGYKDMVVDACGCR